MLNLRHVNLVAWQRADDLADFEKNVNGVGAPLIGLVRHEQSSVGPATLAVFLAFVLWMFILS
jgi:hypothetical protein